ncbi:MAG: 4a-hydroxytetrahydrobiopterin dehydratase [Gammaproteobacteria bacterium]|nr:4a-hydroxytetrahydrobiopterin dehydratase [Gammaproteobacteria bacterium]|tara:strand:- start:99500 stop:99850 length:351 start_codon:yes stop_codon:yes gene_type:complete
MSKLNDDLSKKKCQPCEGGLDPMTYDEAKHLLSKLSNGWILSQDGKKIYKDYKTKNYYEITSLINLVIWLSNKEDHHPEINFSYNTARITYFTYAINGLSENDFICASKIDLATKI